MKLGGNKMGYNIYYEGRIELDKPLDDKTYNIIKGLGKTRRMRWDADKLEQDGIALKSEIGYWGEFFFGVQDMKPKSQREFESKYVIDHNCPPPGQPELWGVWTVTDDRLGLAWNRNEKSYGGHEWLKYLVKSIFIPRGYYPRGIINWFTEGHWYENKWHTVVEGKSVRKYRGYNRKQKEPDIDGWYEEELQSYDEYHQKWLKNLMDNKVEFLHEHRPWKNEKTDAEFVLSFNLYLENNIVQATYDRKEICYAKYLYENLRIVDGKIIHNEDSSDIDKVINDHETLMKVKDLIEEYILLTPDFLEEAVV